MLNQEKFLDSPFYPSPFERQVLKKSFPSTTPITFQRVLNISLIIQFIISLIHCVSWWRFLSPHVDIIGW